jgi:hypothetical protein
MQYFESRLEGRDTMPPVVQPVCQHGDRVMEEEAKAASNIAPHAIPRREIEHTHNTKE